MPTATVAGAAPRAVLAAVTVNLAGVLPLFLTGAMAVQIGRDLSFGPLGIGLLSGSYAAAALAGSAPLGRRVGRIGVRSSMRWAAVAAAAALIAAAVAPGVGWLAAAMVVGGAANAIGQPAGNAAVAQHLPSHRYGIGFAVKQSGIPVATLLAGLAVPAIALPFGWRWAYAAAGLVAVLAWVLPPRDLPLDSRRTEGDVPQPMRSGLWLLAGSLLLAVVAATSIGAFGASGAVAVGLSEAEAGLLIAAGGVGGLAFRLALGALADRLGHGALLMVSGLVAVGGLGWLLMAVGQPTVYVAGLLLANAFGWGWPGLLHLSVAQLFPTSTAAASGVTQTGVSAGLLVGPLVLGYLAAARGWPTMWLVAAGSAFTAAALILLARRHLSAAARHPH